VPGAARDVAVLAALGLAVRVAWVWHGAWVGGDTNDYLTMAKNVAFHHVFSREADAATLTPTARRPPLYPALVAALWWGDAAPTFSVMLLQAVLGAGTVALVYLTARDRFGRRVALVAGVCLALAPMSGLYTAVVLTETLFTFLLTLGMFWWGRGRLVPTGVAFGLASLTRPTLLPFLVALPFITLLPAWRPQRRGYLTILLAAAAVTSFWVARNAVVFREFIPFATSNTGMNLLCGTVDADVFSSRVRDDGGEWVAHPTQLPLIRVGREFSETERDRERMRRALARIKDRPLHWLVVRAKQYPKLFVDTGDYLLGPGNVSLRAALRQRNPLVLLVKLSFVFGNLLVFALAAFGVFKERARLVSLSHLVLFPVFLLAAHLPMWVESRYALPIMPAVFIFAAVGATGLPKFIKAMRKGQPAEELRR
jgi:4-amino-4-deoxy-L-arabinose transferase-like glycosyltransferase